MIAANLRKSGDSVADQRAFQEARDERVRFAGELVDFGFETVFSHGSNVAFLRALRRVGYEVHLYFVGTEDAEINVARVQDRVAKGGHSVPREKIVSRYDRSLLALTLAIMDCQRTLLFDNSDAVAIDPVSFYEVAGRAVGEVTNAFKPTTGPILTLFPETPRWVQNSVVTRFSKKWEQSEWIKSVNQVIAPQATCKHMDDVDILDDPPKFFSQFKLSIA
jgi:predicted ABC-type ATPase